jgi:(4-O-methyl)-D-glucuronate---lignin esterase
MESSIVEGTVSQEMNRAFSLLAAVIFTFAAAASTCASARATDLENGFRHPPSAVRPWVFWFWINGNISREGITKDLESMKRVGIGGVLWMGVSGPHWAPQGPVKAESRQWHQAMQWAISEADRLGIAFGLTVDFGYGSGGPHITPDLSMQKLVWSKTVVQGPKPVALKLPRPVVDYRPALTKAWLRPGQTINPVVLKALKEVDSYRDVAVFAFPSPQDQSTAIADLNQYDGLTWKTDLPSLSEDHKLSALARRNVIDLSDHMTHDGRLRWNAPKGRWTVVRLGYASNFQMTRPCPQAAVGLECDRLNPRGIEAHFEHHLKPILDAAGDKAGRTLQYIHIDSWEAGGQNWSAGFAKEFRKRRGYDIRPWLPVLTGHVVESPEKTDRFLGDMRQTVSEVILSNYIDRLRQLIAPYGVQFSCEPYGRLCVNQLTYGGRADFPIAEFWTERARPPFTTKSQPKPFPTFSPYWYNSMKAVASVANTYGKPRAGAEAFTGCRGWMDYPYLLKGMGDEAFCNGISQYVIHCSAHQAYDRMMPGLTHRRWGQHFNRHQTWWDYSKPYFDYAARCQFLLQKGRRVVDVACLYHEGAPLNFNDIKFALPPGYDYDFCTSEIIQRMQVKDGRIYLPSGASYRYLVLPRSGRLTLPTALKVEQLREAGASIYLQSRIAGTPGLEGYPQADRQVRDLCANWPLLPQGGWSKVFAADKLPADFEGANLKWTHRRTGKVDLYFVANTQPVPMKQQCVFRTTAESAELWNPETGEIFALPVTRQDDGRSRAELHFEPVQSWFVVFRDKPSLYRSRQDPFPSWKPVQQLAGRWDVNFDPAWGPLQPITLDKLISWSEHPDPLVKYYSGTATYRKTFEAPQSAMLKGDSRLSLDLGRVEVMARVRLNGKDCGIAWKPPYRVDIRHALKAGHNLLEIDVVNTWVNRMIGDEQLPLDAKWKDWETLLKWPDWFKKGRRSPTGRYTFTSVRYYTKNSPLMPSGLLGPVRILLCNGRDKVPSQGTPGHDGSAGPVAPRAAAPHR